jgi:hypothetical protein
MIKRELYFKDGTLFSNGYERVVHGGRGDYVELTKEQIAVELKSHFDQPIPPEIDLDVDYYYYWLEPIDRYEKVYWQVKTVSYADYKTGYYYISPDFLKPFTGIELF